MWKVLLGWAATPAATAWVALAGIALVGGCYFAYDLRGDRIADLEMQLLECNGTAKQAKAIKELSKRVTDQLQEQADGDVEKLNALPDECYQLDGPSPLDGLLKPANKKPGD
jgi:uncharacterized coiled-coil protein SlyX